MSEASNREEQALLGDALRGDAHAKWKLGIWYSNKGHSVEAIKWQRLAAEQDPACAHAFGFQYHIQKNPDEAARWYRFAAERGYLLSAVSLGSMYNQGEGVALDSDEALRWFRLAEEKAIEQDDFDAMFHLGEAYSVGVLCDVAKSIKWYSLAAERSDGAYAHSVGWKFAQGLGVPRNLVEAARWYRVAAERGDLLSAVWLGSMYSKGEGVPQSSDDATRWFRLAEEKAAIDENDVLIMSALGAAYRVGVLCDPAKSVKWYSMAAERGYTSSMCELAVSYLVGWGGEQNVATSAQWYRLAAEKGDDLGKSMLGQYYELGLGVPKDYVQAYAWRRRSKLDGTEEMRALAEKMTPEEIAEAERLASEWNPQET